MQGSSTNCLFLRGIWLLINSEAKVNKRFRFIHHTKDVLGLLPLADSGVEALHEDENVVGGHGSVETVRGRTTRSSKSNSDSHDFRSVDGSVDSFDGSSSAVNPDLVLESLHGTLGPHTAIRSIDYSDILLEGGVPFTSSVALGYL